MSKRLLQLLRDNSQRPVRNLNIISNDNSTDVYLYDVIDPYWGVDAKSFTELLASLKGKPVNLRINSPGGDVFEARAMATAVRQHGNVDTYIDSLAASAATYVALAGKTVHMATGAFFMIHQAWTFAYGNSADLRTTAGLLDKIDASIVADYQNKSGQTIEQIQQWMADETWFTAQEAKDNGFIDLIMDSQPASPAAQAAHNRVANQADWNLSVYDKVPAALRETKPKPEPDPIDHPSRIAALRRMSLLEKIMP